MQKQSTCLTRLSGDVHLILIFESLGIANKEDFPSHFLKDFFWVAFLVWRLNWLQVLVQY